MIEFQKNNASLSFSEAVLKGDKGDPGVTPNIQIGTVETLPESPATASITGTPENPLLNLGIPQGKDGEGGGDGASTAEKISYTNTDLPDVANVKTALDKVVKEQRGHGTDIEAINDMLGNLHKNSHTHSNKGILDKLSVYNGKLQYNGSDVGLKGDKGDTGAAGADGYTPVKGTDYWTAADKTEIVNDTLAALPTWNGGGY